MRKEVVWKKPWGGKWGIISIWWENGQIFLFFSAQFCILRSVFLTDPLSLCYSTLVVQIWVHVQVRFMPLVTWWCGSSYWSRVGQQGSCALHGRRWGWSRVAAAAAAGGVWCAGGDTRSSSSEWRWSPKPSKTLQDTNRHIRSFQINPQTHNGSFLLCGGPGREVRGWQMLVKCSNVVCLASITVHVCLWMILSRKSKGQYD